MLGFGSISSTAISGSPFRLVGTVASIAAAISFTFTASPNLTSHVPVVASGTITFGASGNISVLVPISARGGITFSASPTWSALVPVSAIGRITWDVNAKLGFAGKPLVTTAMFDSFTVQAEAHDFSTVAMSDSFTSRGVS